MDAILVALEDQSGLAEHVARRLGCPLHFAKVSEYPDTEFRVSLQDPDQFAGSKALILQSTYAPVNDHVMMVSFLAHELKNAQAKEVVAVIPYFGYSRQEESDIKGKPGQVEVIAKLLESAGVDALITVELHEPFIADFFSIPVYNISLIEVLADHINRRFSSIKQDICLISPDKGAQDFVYGISQLLQVGTIVFTKERFGPSQTRLVGKTGDCVGTTAIIIDDIISTGGTAIGVAQELMSMGYNNVYGYFVHPVLSGEALYRLAQSPFNEMYVSNTIPVFKSHEGIQIEVFDISDRIATVIEQLV